MILILAILLVTPKTKYSELAVALICFCKAIADMFDESAVFIYFTSLKSNTIF